jgi:hypothetical protein
MKVIRDSPSGFPTDASDTRRASMQIGKIGLQSNPKDEPGGIKITLLALAPPLARGFSFPLGSIPCELRRNYSYHPIRR